jgi:hypothetical protein
MLFTILYSPLGMDSEVPEKFNAQGCELRVTAITWVCEGDFQCLDDPFTALAQNNNAVSEVESFIDVVRYQKDCGAKAIDHIGEQVLHVQAGECIQRGEGFVHKKHAWMADEGPR